MMKSLIFISLFLLIFTTQKVGAQSAIGQDTSEVIKLNKQGFAIRLTNPNQSVVIGTRSLDLAQRLNYDAGIGEAYRVMGIGYYYLNQSKKAIDCYLTALSHFQKIKDIRGQGKVYNNIGVLYRNDDYDLSLEFLTKALNIAKKVNADNMIAPIYLNIGVVYFHKNSFYQALNYYNKSNELFLRLKDTVNLIQCMQNKGVIYFNLQQFDMAESLLTEANKEAKQLDLNESIASIDLTLADLYIAKNKFDQAEKIIAEGTTFSSITKNEKTQSDFKLTSYQLELKRKNYKGAVTILYSIYHLDSALYKQGISTQLSLVREQATQLARQKETELLIQREKYDRVKFWAVAVVAVLLLIFVGLLVTNVKRKAKTNMQLTNLNAEVSRQKDNLDRINHHLEEIIDERTKDLQIKNRKLSEYSSYLSHQIRGPIATLKGLLNLEKEGLVDEPECIRMMNKSVGEIDDKIMEMSDMLHDPGRAGF